MEMDIGEGTIQVVGDSKVKTLLTGQILDISPVISNSELVDLHSLIDFKKNSRGSSCIKAKPSLSKLAEIHALGYTNPFMMTTFQQKILNRPKNGPKTDCSSNKENTTCSVGISEQIVSCGGKDGDYRPVINLKSLTDFCFKSEGLFYIMQLIKKGIACANWTRGIYTSVFH